MEIRLVKGSDYYAISPLINEWWGGRQMSDMLPKLFFDHFSNTSFVAEKEGENDSLAFLREREIVHSQRFREAVEILKEERDRKKFF